MGIKNKGGRGRGEIGKFYNPLEAWSNNVVKPGILDIDRLSTISISLIFCFDRRGGGGGGVLKLGI